MAEQGGAFVDLYTGRYHSKIGLNLTIAIFPFLLAFLHAQKYISIPVSSRIIIIQLVLFILPIALAVLGIFLGIKGCREGDTAFGAFVIILASVSLAITFWFAFWALNDLSFLYKYGFLMA